MNSIEISTENVVEELLSNIPEFETWMKIDFNDDPGTNLTFFTVFLNEQIDKNEDQDLLNRCAKFLNLMTDSTDINVIDILGTMIFIGLYDESNKNLPGFLERLSEKALKSYKINIEHRTGKVK